MSLFATQAPLRISLGGGGTDLPSYYRDHEGFLVAGAIDKYVYFMVHTVFQNTYRMKYSSFEEVETAEEIKHPLLREALLRYWRGAPLEIASVADVPAGTGMGSSGAFTVGLLKALALARRTSITAGDLAERACSIEIDILGEPVGKQDQYVAAHGGICTYTFHSDGTTSVEPIELETQTLADLRQKMLLFYTGTSRPAASILADQVARTASGDGGMLDNLHRIKKLGYQSADLLRSGDLDGYAELMHEHWQVKQERSPGMSDPHIDDLYTLARRSGVVGGKLVGAGGGGFLLVYASRPEDTRQAMTAAGLQELPFDFDFQGARGRDLG